MKLFSITTTTDVVFDFLMEDQYNMENARKVFARDFPKHAIKTITWSKMDVCVP